MGDSASELELASILTRLGAIIVCKDQLHDSLRSMLHDRRFEIGSVLCFFKTIKSSVLNRLLAYQARSMVGLHDGGEITLWALQRIWFLLRSAFRSGQLWEWAWRTVSLQPLTLP